MKNTYAVQFETITGKTLFIRNYENGLNTVTSDERKVFLFTNKETARQAARYFLSYVLPEYATFEIYKTN